MVTLPEEVQGKRYDSTSLIAILNHNGLRTGFELRGIKFDESDVIA